MTTYNMHRKFGEILVVRFSSYASGQTDRERGMNGGVGKKGRSVPSTFQTKVTPLPPVNRHTSHDPEETERRRPEGNTCMVLKCQTAGGNLLFPDVITSGELYEITLCGINICCRNGTGSCINQTVTA